MQEIGALTPPRSSDGHPRLARLQGLICGGLLLALLGSSVLMYRCSLSSGTPVAGIQVGQVEMGRLDGDDLDRALARQVHRYLDGRVLLRVGTHTLSLSRRDLGATVDTKAMRDRLSTAGKTGHLLQDLHTRVRARRGRLTVPMAVSLNPKIAAALFGRLKEQVDRPAVPIRLDLDHQRIKPGAEGYLLRVFDSIAAAELALRQGRTTVDLSVTIRQPPRPQGLAKGIDAAKMDIGQVLGHFATVYSLKDKDRDRAFNLQVGASKLDGRILAPGETLKFNDTVGRRTKAEGYRMAPVISEGELVDGMAGGACQLSSTLFAASFFAGLELISSRPHTRPSSYIKMGLDAAVAYPTTDLVLKNPYPFPVAIHFKVNQGRVRVRLLGKGRPWRKVQFQREVKEVIPFKEVIRADPGIPRGHRLVSQVGVPGFTLIRRRLLFKGNGGKPDRTEERTLRYPPTTQYVKQGTGPADSQWTPPEPKKPFGEVSPEFILAQ